MKSTHHTIEFSNFNNFTPDILLASSASGEKRLHAVICLVTSTLKYRVTHSVEVVLLSDNLNDAIECYNNIK